MAIVRMHEIADATWSRAWAIDTTAEFIAFLLTYGAPYGPKRGDVVFDIEANRSYLVINAGQATQISNLAEAPIDLTGDVTGILPIANGGTALSSLSFATQAFNAAHFFGNGSMTWTVNSTAVLKNSYLVLGKLLFWSLYVSWFTGTSTVGGTPNTILSVTIPNGLSVAGANAVVAPILIENGAVANPLNYSVAANGSALTISKLSAANIAAGTFGIVTGMMVLELP